MQKKLLAIAVAGVLAAPAVALAQSSVTISGVIKISLDNVNLGGFTRTGNNSETRVADDSSQIHFNIVEDLGGGLAAIAKVDWRVTLDTGADAVTGNTWVGLRSKSWGQVTIGRHDLHYFNRESELTAKAGSLKADSISILAFAGGGGTAIAGATRTANTTQWISPNWGGFTLIGAYSTNPTAPEADIGTTARKGRAWNINPNFQAPNFQVGYSYWSQKADGAGAGSDQRADRLYGSYKWGGFKLGLAWDKSKIKTGATGTETSNRTAWSIPLQYQVGNHNIYGHFDKARDDKSTAVQDGAKMYAVAYVYDLSKRTSVGVTYAKISNDTGAFYQPFTGTGGLGNAASTAAPGEDPRVIAATIRHAF